MPDELQLPGPVSAELLALAAANVPSGVANLHPMVVAEARNATVTDVDGNTFLDFTGGIGVLNVGHLPDEVRAAIEEQAAKFLHTCYQVLPHEPYIRLAAALNRLVPGDVDRRTFFVNSGAEATENAVKLSRHFTGRDGVLAFEHAFHGRTMFGMAMTAKYRPYKAGFGPDAPSVHRMPFPYCYRCPVGREWGSCDYACLDVVAERIEKVVGDDRAACAIIEPVAGEGGFIPAPDGYLQRLADLCRSYGILFVADEVQTGFGRTSRVFAVEHSEGLSPDILVSAKSIAAGLPLAAVTGRTDVMDHVQAGGLGTTFGGNPVACAAGLAVVGMFDQSDMLARARATAEAIEARLADLAERHTIIGDHRGLGAMQGIELVTDRTTKEPAAAQAAEIVAAARSRGLLLLRCGTFDNVIRILCPLTIDHDDLHHGFDVLDECLSLVAV